MDDRRHDCRGDQRSLRSKSSVTGIMLVKDNGRLLRTSSSSLNNAPPSILNATYASAGMTSRNPSTVQGSLGPSPLSASALSASALHASALSSQNHHPKDRPSPVSDRSRGSPRGSPQLTRLERTYVELRRQPRLGGHPQQANPQVAATTVTGAGSRTVSGTVVSSMGAGGGGGGGNGGGAGGIGGGGASGVVVIGGGGGGGLVSGRSKSAVVGRASGGVSLRELTSSSSGAASGPAGGASASGNNSGGVRGKVALHVDSTTTLPSLPPPGPLRYGASVSSLPAVLGGQQQKLQHDLGDALPKNRKYLPNISLPRAILNNTLVDARTRSSVLNGGNSRGNGQVRQNALARPLIKNTPPEKPRKESISQESLREQTTTGTQAPPVPPPPAPQPPREDDYQGQPIHTIALWSNVPQLPVKDPPVKPNMNGGGGCCATCCTRIRTASCGSILLLPLHILVLLLLVGYLALGAFIFSRLEGNSLEVASQGHQPSTVRLPGTPKSEGMLDANNEMVEKILNKSMDMVMEKSIDEVFRAIMFSPRMQHAIRVFEMFRGDQLPSNNQLDILSEAVVTEWRMSLYNLTARYYSLVTRHAYGYKVGPLERSRAWDSEEPPATASWTLWASLLHAFCLVTTMGGSVQANSSGGRATTVVYSFVGVVLYLGAVAVWAARMTTILSLIIKIFSRKKVDSSSGKMLGPHYQQSSQYTQRLSQLHQSPAGLLISVFILLVYILSAGVLVVGGSHYGRGLENVLLALATVRPPNPLPETSSDVMGFIGFITVGHILLALIFSIIMALTSRWWTSGGTTS